MAKKQRSELTAGLFVVVALGAGIGVLLWLGAAKVFRRPSQTAAFFVPEETGSVGLAEGDFVRVNDAVVGEIGEIRYDPARKGTLYFADITRRDVKVHADGQAYVAVALVGSRFLVITHRGTQGKPLAGADNPIVISGGAMERALKDLAAAAENVRKQLDEKERGSLMQRILHIAAMISGEMDADREDSLMAKVHVSAGDVNTITKRVMRQTDVKDPQTVFAKIDRTAGHVEATAATLHEQTNMDDPKSMLAKAGDSVDNLKGLTADAAAAIRRVRPDVEATAARLRRLTEKDLTDLFVELRRAGTSVVETAANLKAMSASGREVVALNRLRLDDTLANLKIMSANLSAAAKEIRRNPWRLLHRPKGRLTDRENLYDAARAFGEGAGELRDAVARLEALSKMPPEAPETRPALQKVIAHLEASFAKFRRVEDALFEKVAAGVGSAPETPASGPANPGQ